MWYYELMIIVVLGAGVDKQGNIPEDAKSRLTEAKKLYNKYNAPILLCGKYSVLSSDNPPQITEAEAMQNILITNSEIKKEDIWIEKESQDTISAAYYAKTKYFIPYNEKTAIVITSVFHLDRVRYIFHKVFGKDYNLHFSGTTFNLCCGLKPIIIQRQNQLTEKALQLLKDVQEGDHLSAINKTIKVGER